MSRKKRQRSKHLISLRHRESTKHKGPIIKFLSEWNHRHPVFMFLMTFSVLMGLFYGFALFTNFFENPFMLGYLNWIATVSGFILGLLGQSVHVSGNNISAAFSVSIDRGCSAFEPIALFISAVIAFPAFYLKKIPGIIFGVLSLVILNLIRVITLVLIGTYFPKFFHLMHIDVWQGLFVFFAVILWVVWILWAMQKQIPIEETSGDSKSD